MVGFITLFGVAISNGILLISHYEYLRHEENAPNDQALIVRGASERLAPILMTAGATVLRLLPLIISGELLGSGRPVSLAAAFVIVTIWTVLAGLGTPWAYGAWG